MAAAGIVASGAALADKPVWAGNGGKGKHDKSDKKETVYFDSQRRVAVHDYYVNEFHGGKCPPGLAKKHNGCMPPGQAKKQWHMGQPLPRDVVIYDLPPTLVVKIGVPPPGYKYVRVASDILLIAVGTSMVVEAINDLGRM